MKIAQVMGRGIEGAGVTKYAIELNKFFKKNKIDSEVFVVTDKKWGRMNNQDFPKYKEISDYVETSKYLNTFDYVFFHSIPSIKHSEECKNGFFEMVKNISTKKVFFQNDHKAQSLSRNSFLYETVELCDIVVAFNTTCEFFTKLKERFGSKVTSKYVHLHNGFNFEEMNMFRKENHDKKITYLGRFATFKDPERLIKIIDKTKKENIMLEMIGVERSLGALNIFYEDIDKRIPNSKVIEVNKKTLESGLDLQNRDLSRVYIWGPYIWKEGVNQLSNAMFGSDFFHLKESAYGDNLEYAQCEIVSVGCVPIFDYHWADNCFIYENGKKTNTKFIDVENYGLFLKKDCSNVDEVINNINEIYNNKNLHKKYVETSYEVTKNHCDLNDVFSDLLNNILNHKYEEEKSEDIFSLGMGF